MEPDLRTDPALAAVLEELKAREPIFHRPEFGTSRAAFDALMAPEYWEIGASGRRYSREFILDTLEKRHEQPVQEIWEVSDFHCRELTPGIYLLTYTLLQERARLTRRSTIWQRTAEGWKIVFHQGTLVSGT